MKIIKNKRGVESCDKFKHQIKIEDNKTSIESTSSIQSTIDEIEKNISAKLNEIMTSAEYGFDPDEVPKYSAVDVEETSDDRIRIEVRAELSYDSLIELADSLNEIVEYYDSYAYFDPVEPGIIEAYIDVDSTN